MIFLYTENLIFWAESYFTIYCKPSIFHSDRSHQILIIKGLTTIQSSSLSLSLSQNDSFDACILEWSLNVFCFFFFVFFFVCVCVISCIGIQRVNDVFCHKMDLVLFCFYEVRSSGRCSVRLKKLIIDLILCVLRNE